MELMNINDEVVLVFNNELIVYGYIFLIIVVVKIYANIFVRNF